MAYDKSKLLDIHPLSLEGDSITAHTRKVMKALRIRAAKGEPLSREETKALKNADQRILQARRARARQKERAALTDTIPLQPTYSTVQIHNLIPAQTVKQQQCTVEPDKNAWKLMESPKHLAYLEEQERRRTAGEALLKAARDRVKGGSTD